MTDKWNDYGKFKSLVDAYDGYTFWFEQGYSATFRFWLADAPNEGQHPYRYELVLHGPQNDRMMGYDNAHPVKWKSGMFRHRSENPDHYHRTGSDPGRPYEFVSITQVLKDFFNKTESTLENLGISNTILEVTETPKHNLPRSKK